MTLNDLFRKLIFVFVVNILPTLQQVELWVGVGDQFEPELWVEKKH